MTPNRTSRKSGFTIILGNLCGFLPVTLFLVGCSGQAPVQSPPFDLCIDEFDAQQAYAEVASLVALGPRVSGSDNAHRAARHLQQRLESFGISTDLDFFEDHAPAGTTTFVNVVGTVPGNCPEQIILGSHFDTKYGIKNFVGANDSGSSSGLVLELARLWQSCTTHSSKRPTLSIVLFDGEEARNRYGPHDGFHGSRHYVRELRESGELESVMAMILLDMVGDRDLSITIPRNSSPDLAYLAFRGAEAVGCRAEFGWHDGAVGDDHVAFLDAGIPAIDLIDFEFGSKPGKNNYWHTQEDTMDKISVESLDKVGRVTLHLLQSIVNQPSSTPR